MKLVSTAQMRAIERSAIASGVSVEALMENAGRAVAECVRRRAGSVAGLRVLVLVGNGNNGGDGLVAARHLNDWGAAVTVCLVITRNSNDPNLSRLANRDICIVGGEGSSVSLRDVVSRADVVVDAILGTGKRRPLAGFALNALNEIRHARQGGRPLVVAVNLPSGLDGDDGSVDDATLVADLTVSLGFPKIGLFMPPGNAFVGDCLFEGISLASTPDFDVCGEVIDDQLVSGLLPDRSRYSNKGDFGKLLVVAGSEEYVGAAYLVCASAARSGTGLVTLATSPAIKQVMSGKLTEATHLPLAGRHDRSDVASAVERVMARIGESNAVAIGPGIGRSGFMSDLVGVVLSADRLGSFPPLVLDADALNIVATIPEWYHRLGSRCIVTPHPGEMARLTGLTVPEIQSDRIGVSKNSASLWGKVVVLKGANTVIAAPDGRFAISPYANAALASAGTGDVLTGLMAGLAAQGLEPLSAAMAAVHIHGKAGEKLSSEIGDRGAIASDMLGEIPQVMRGLRLYH